MKTLLKFALLSVVVATLWGCTKSDEQITTSLDVTANNISGTWYLAEVNGQPLAKGNFVYIDFVRKDALFTMYQNVDSQYTRKLTGRFAIKKDDLLGSVIWGTYDYDMGDWGHEYIVRDLGADSMTWIATDDQTDISVYKRCDTIPDDVIVISSVE